MHCLMFRCKGLIFPIYESFRFILESHFKLLQIYYIRKAKSSVSASVLNCFFIYGANLFCYTILSVSIYFILFFFRWNYLHDLQISCIKTAVCYYKKSKFVRISWIIVPLYIDTLIQDDELHFEPPMTIQSL